MGGSAGGGLEPAVWAIYNLWTRRTRPGVRRRRRRRFPCFSALASVTKLPDPFSHLVNYSEYFYSQHRTSAGVCSHTSGELPLSTCVCLRILRIFTNLHIYPVCCWPTSEEQIIIIILRARVVHFAAPHHHKCANIFSIHCFLLYEWPKCTLKLITSNRNLHPQRKNGGKFSCGWKITFFRLKSDYLLLVYPCKKGSTAVGHALRFT